MRIKDLWKDVNQTEHRDRSLRNWDLIDKTRDTPIIHKNLKHEENPHLNKNNINWYQ